MKGTIIVLVGLGMAALAGLALLLHIWHPSVIDRRDAVGMYVAFHEALVEGQQAHLSDWVLTNDETSRLVLLRLLAGTAVVDEALCRRFGGSDLHPLPLRPLLPQRHADPTDVTTLEDDRGRMVQIVREGGRLFIDLRSLDLTRITPAEAESMRLAMINFAGRVESGEFGSHEEARAAYESWILARHRRTEGAAVAAAQGKPWVTDRLMRYFGKKGYFERRG